MNRWFYTQLWRIAPPLIRHYLKKRAVKSPAYLYHWGERFGEPFDRPVQRPIWVHAVSVGETRAAQPLVEALRRHFPDAPLLMTQMTPTGRAAAKELFPDAQCRYLPYDKPEWVAQFLKEHRPLFGVLMETEIWPNLMHACADAHVPLFLANARLSEKSQRGYLKIRNLFEPALQTLSGCFAQTAEDAERLHLIGASNVHVCGNTKYDISPPERMRALAAAFRERIGTTKTKRRSCSKRGKNMPAMPCWSSFRAIRSVFRRPLKRRRHWVIPFKNAATTCRFPDKPKSGWATAWANSLPTTSVRMSPLSAAASWTAAVKTSSSR